MTLPSIRLTRRAAVFGISLAALACAAGQACGGAAPARVSPPSTSTVPPAASSVAQSPPAGTASSSSASSAPAASASAPASTPPAETVSFPPPAFAPPYERVAQAGDGIWTTLPEIAGSDAEPLLVRSVVHPHTIKRFTSVALAAFDLRRVEVRLVAGTAEPESRAVPAERRTGLVPPADLAHLLAVFNGGFQAKHGHYGMRIGDDVYLPAVADSCTFGLGRDGKAIVGTWTAVAEHEAGLIAWRQTPPCLLEQGVTNSSLERDASSRKWGISIEGKLEIRRSAVGVDASGRVLYFGIGEEVTPKDLAVAMKAAGAVSAAQLDINWSYTRFLVYGQAGPSGAPEVVYTLLPKMKHGKSEYVSRAAPRDFFYVRRKGTAD